MKEFLTPVEYQKELERINLAKSNQIIKWRESAQKFLESNQFVRLGPNTNTSIVYGRLYKNKYNIAVDFTDFTDSGEVSLLIRDNVNGVPLFRQLVSVEKMKETICFYLNGDNELVTHKFILTVTNSLSEAENIRKLLELNKGFDINPFKE